MTKQEDLHNIKCGNRCVAYTETQYPLTNTPVRGDAFVYTDQKAIESSGREAQLIRRENTGTMSTSV